MEMFMMKAKLTIAAVAMSAFYACTASANSGAYISGILGASIVNMHDTKISDTLSSGGESEYNESIQFKNKNKGVFGGGVALGYDFNDQYQVPVRIELAATFRGDASASQTFTDDEGDSETIKNKVSMATYMVNGYYDFYNSSDFIPYLTAGIGMSHLKHKISDEDSDDISASSNNFAWGLGAGVKYIITSNISVDASYRYINGGKVTSSSTDSYDTYSNTIKTKAKAESNDLMIGISYKF